MGILDKIFGGENRETKAQNIKFSQLDGWIKNKLETKNSAVYAECKEIVEDVRDSVKDIRALIERLEQEGFQHNVPVKVYKIVKASKPKYIAGILEILNKIEEKYPKNYTGLEEFHKILNESLLNISKISMSHGRYLPMAFEDLITEISRGTKHLFELNNKLALNLKPNDITVTYKNLLSETGEIKNLKEQLDTIIKREASMKDNIKSIMTEREKLKDEMDDLVKSEEHVRCAELEEQYKDILKSKENIESTIYNNLHPLVRIMRKFRHILEEKPEFKNVLHRIDKYVDKPVEEFISDNNRDINSILGQVKESIERNEMDMKDVEKKKISEKIDSVIVNLSDDLRQKYMLLQEKEAEIKSKIAQIDIKNRIETINYNINELDRKLSLEHNNLTKVINRRDMVNDEIKNKIDNLQDMISKIEGIRILIS